MDFRRIEVIFIIVFAILNAYLFGSYWQYQLESGTVSSTSSSRNTTILKEMRNDQITYMPLSNTKSSGYYASAKVDTSLKNDLKRLIDQNARVSGDKIYSTLADPVTINVKQPQKKLNAFVKNRNNIIFGSQYTYNVNLSNSTQIVYTQMIDGRPVYSKAGQLIFYVNGAQEVTGYTQGHLANQEQLREESDLISQTRAVTWLYQYNEIPNNSKIEWAELGYTNLLTTDNGVVYVPTWIIGIKSKSSTGIETKRINAFSGVLIKKDSEASESTKTVQQVVDSVSSSSEEASSASGGTARISTALNSASSNSSADTTNSSSVTSSASTGSSAITSQSSSSGANSESE
ncbi:hypothetical protein FEZ51_02330 [Pediococcus stilesii]|uniref:Regulatory protein YycH-like domain-containing protein n=1 Tax=Pediococcus stilesii TaxID=331679 RepID=A0A5R9BWL6_9LACO|nr:two-component system regulatory protein YycI [Pediococcus stilesii]TLQ05098.1 hypothetical protein FEZ51_02330 [Pediococcus stilesii]